MLLEADKIYQGTSQINRGTGPGVDTPLCSSGDQSTLELLYTPKESP